MSTYELHKGDALDLISDWSTPLDLVVTDPPYALTGSGEEHAISATVACVLRETAKHVRVGSWMLVFSASSWRSISYMVEAVRGILSPVRVANWVKPVAKTQVRTPGWSWTTVPVIAMRRGPKNNPLLETNPGIRDWVECSPLARGRRAKLPNEVASWAVQPFVVPGGTFLDPFAGSGALPLVASSFGMHAHGFEKNPPVEVQDG